MLSRVADRIFWMSRQMERAENMARILGVTSNLVLLDTGKLHEQNLLAPLSITETEAAYHERHDKLGLAALIEFMALDEKNPSSIYSCLKGARENAHAVRWLITSEMWETLNATWLEVRAIPKHRVTGSGATEFFDWVKERSHLFRGVTYGTIVRGEAFNFSRLGTFLERADNTARILDVKYHILLPSVEDVGGALDYYQWAALLRSVSAFETYRQLYRDQIFPVKEALARIRGQKDEPAKRLASELHARLSYADVEEVFQGGLHEFLTTVLTDIGELGSRIQRAYLGAV